MFYNRFKSYGLHTHMTEELKKSFIKPKALFGEFHREVSSLPDAQEYSEYFRTYVPDTTNSEYIDEVFALKDLFHYLTAKDYEEIYEEDICKFDDDVDVSEIYSTAGNNSVGRYWQYIFYHRKEEPWKFHEICFSETDLGEKEIIISYYGGKIYRIEFSPGASLKRSEYRKTNDYYYYRSIPYGISITTPNDETYIYELDGIFNIRSMANDILADTKALHYLVKFYSKTLGEEYVNRLTKNI